MHLLLFKCIKHLCIIVEIIYNVANLYLFFVKGGRFSVDHIKMSTIRHFQLSLRYDMR